MKRNNSTDEVQIKSYPWYLDDWFASETRASFNLAERGLYREMLVADDHLIIDSPAWERDHCPPSPKECFTCGAPSSSLSRTNAERFRI